MLILILDQLFQSLAKEGRVCNHRNFIEMGKMFGISNKIAYLAVRRYALENSLLKVRFSESEAGDDDAKDDDYTIFGNTPLDAEKTVVEL